MVGRSGTERDKEVSKIKMHCPAKEYIYFIPWRRILRGWRNEKTRTNVKIVKVSVGCWRVFLSNFIAHATFNFTSA